MSYGYGSPPPPGYGQNPRDGITAALLQIAQPPPVPPGQPPQIPGLGQVGDAGMSPLGGPAQSPPMGGAAPMSGGMALPGIMQPGVLPPGIAPQTALAGGNAPPLPMPPRGAGG